jgi:two-component system chemotaxis sensor kinase CheA
MAGFDISKYREMFLEEAVDLFESADSLLLEAENNGFLSDEQMSQLFRDVHTLKGSGASVELSMFAEFTHDVENMMDKLRNHQIEFIPAMVATLIDCMDTMKEILNREVTDGVDKSLFDELTQQLIQEIKAYLSNQHPAQSKTHEIKETPKNTIQKEIKAADAFSTTAYQLAQSEDFGFFDSDLDGKCGKDTPYGIFSDDDSENNKERYGFFDESLNEISKTTPDIKLEHHENDDFGFFDDIPSGILHDDVKPQTITQNNTKQEPINNQQQDHADPQIKMPSLAQRQMAQKEDEKKAIATAANTNNIRVNLDKIDTLMNNVGDLVITNAMLTQFATTIGETKTRVSVLERLELLERHIREMQDSIMSIRMVPMESIYSKFPKVVRDISKKLDKKVEFKHYGDNVEIDKAMIEGLTDPLMHIIRNSLDHGLETPSERLSAGKDETGIIAISAEQANGQMIITISDDGRGINLSRVSAKALENGLIDEHQLAQMSDSDKAMLIFGAGLTTAEEITDISGRGVGMDVVKTNINKLGGVIRLETGLGIGTTITIVLPLTLAILDGLDIAVGDRKYILPISAIVESLQPTFEMIKKIGDGTQDLLMLREEFIPVVRLHQLFNVPSKYSDLEDGMLIVVKSGNLKVALFIDEFLHQHQVVVKPLDKNFRSVEGIGAATVRGDGSIGLILDVLGIIDAQKKVDKDSLENIKKAS